MLKEYILPETAPDAPGQLYNLATDSGEKVNLYYEKPEVVAELKQQLEKFKTSGQSAPPRH
jgi:hypothetical protein